MLRVDNKSEQRLQKLEGGERIKVPFLKIIQDYITRYIKDPIEREIFS